MKFFTTRHRHHAAAEGWQDTGARGRNKAGVTPRRRESALLALVLLLAAALRLWLLNRAGFGYLYYAAAARSMAGDWRHFFYVSFDPAGAVAVDKPPLALWVQALSVRLFGWHGLSLLVPGALAGVTAVWLVYALVRRTHGHLAGLLAALALALTPVAVATDRLNVADPFLNLLLLGAALATLRAAETGRTGFLLLAAALVGCGFNAKMGSAFGLLPALAALYLLGNRTRPPLRRTARDLALAGAVLAVFAFWWVAAVDLTPPQSRPYLAGSGDNTTRGLLSGYNGMNRVTGRGPFQITPELVKAVMVYNPVPPAYARRGFAHPLDSGRPGAFRLLLPPLAPLGAWLAPLTLAGLAALALGARRGGWASGAGRGVLLWGGWLLAYGSVFSAARGTFHPYYLSTLAPAAAALTGIGAAALWEAYRRRGAAGRRCLLPAALLANALWQVFLARRYPDWSLWLIPLELLGAGLAGAALLALALGEESGGESRPALANAAAVAGAAALLLGPAAWSLTCVLGRNSPLLPTAGPEVVAGYVAPGAPPVAATRALESYLRARRTGKPFFLATGTTFAAAPVIVDTGKPVLAMGGFTGGDPILTPETLARRVEAGEIRHVLIIGFEVAQAPDNLGPLYEWARGHGRAVPAAEWWPGSRGRLPRAVADWRLYEVGPPPASRR